MSRYNPDGLITTVDNNKPEEKMSDCGCGSLMQLERCLPQIINQDQITAKTIINLCETNPSIKLDNNKEHDNINSKPTECTFDLQTIRNAFFTLYRVPYQQEPTLSFNNNYHTILDIENNIIPDNVNGLSLTKQRHLQLADICFHATNNNIQIPPIIQQQQLQSLQLTVGESIASNDNNNDNEVDCCICWDTIILNAESIPIPKRKANKCHNTSNNNQENSYGCTNNIVNSDSEDELKAEFAHPNYKMSCCDSMMHIWCVYRTINSRSYNARYKCCVCQKDINEVERAEINRNGKKWLTLPLKLRNGIAINNTNNDKENDDNNHSNNGNCENASFSDSDCEMEPLVRSTTDSTSVINSNNIPLPSRKRTRSDPNKSTTHSKYVNRQKLTVKPTDPIAYFKWLKKRNKHISPELHQQYYELKAKLQKNGKNNKHKPINYIPRNCDAVRDTEKMFSRPSKVNVNLLIKSLLKKQHKCEAKLNSLSQPKQTSLATVDKAIEIEQRNDIDTQSYYNSRDSEANRQRADSYTESNLKYNIVFNKYNYYAESQTDDHIYNHYNMNLQLLYKHYTNPPLNVFNNPAVVTNSNHNINYSIPNNGYYSGFRYYNPPIPAKPLTWFNNNVTNSHYANNNNTNLFN